MELKKLCYYLISFIIIMQAACFAVELEL